jgi:quinol monooxygenase YgiN
MIKHIVMWKLKDEAEGAGKKENALRMKALLEACSGQTAGMRSFEVGIDIGVDGTPWDVVLVAEFDDRAAIDAYQVHPVHQAAKFFIAKVRDLRAAVDYES